MFIGEAPVGLANLSRLEVLRYPHPMLRQPAEPVSDPSAKIWHAVAEGMLDACDRSHNGVGLAGPQVGIPYRIFVLSINNRRYICINPHLDARKRSSTVVMDEGCLSIPGLYAKIERPKRIIACYTDESGNAVKLGLDGLVARAYLHELGHLNGELFVDLVRENERDRVESFLRKMEMDFHDRKAGLISKEGEK